MNPDLQFSTKNTYTHKNLYSSVHATELSMIDHGYISSLMSENFL